MLDKRLNKIREHVEDWCREHNIPVSVVCDTTGIQGVKIFEKNKSLLKRLFEGLTPIIKADNVFLDAQRVRGGMILAFSAKALSESERQQLLDQIEETREAMTFYDRISDAFVLPIQESDKLEQKEVITDPDFESAALKIAEDQYKVSSSGITRSNQSSRQRNYHSITATHGGVVKRKKKKNNTSEGLEPKPFTIQLVEALDGMATPDGAQPGDLFQKFAKSLSVLGQQMGIGPLQKHLKKQGINWKKSDDGQAIILYVINGQTNAPQPIARISAETLAKPNDFEEQLLNMIDFSKGEAPGAFKQHQDEIRAQEKAVRDIARAVNPQDQSIINQMAGTGGQQATTTPGGGAQAAAATQAATPKPPAKTQPGAMPQQPTGQPSESFNKLMNYIFG